MHISKKLALMPLVALILAGCSGGGDPSRVSQGNSRLPEPGSLASHGFSLANPVQSGNVKLIPIVSNQPPETPQQDIALLAEAQQKGWIKITEGETSFNGVHVENTGPLPILLIAGDLVVGGHQDRVVAHDVLIHPGKGMDVEVFCVEQDRSTGMTDEFTPSNQPVPHRVRREALFARDQSRVWGSVDSFNASAAASPATKTVQGGLKSEQVKVHVAAKEKPILEQLLQVKNVTGYLLIVDGKIDVAELFGSPAHFRKAAPSLIRSILSQQATKISTPRSGMLESSSESFLAAAISGRRSSEHEAETGFENRLQSGQSRAAGRAESANQFSVFSRNGIVGYELYKADASNQRQVLIHGCYANP